MTDSAGDLQDLGVLRIAVCIDLEAAAAFESVCSELRSALADEGIRVDFGPEAALQKASVEIGRLVEYVPNERLVLRWNRAEWQADADYEIDIRFESSTHGTIISTTLRGFGSAVGDNGPELTGWITNQLIGPLALATTPNRLGDWMTDRVARRPSGPAARQGYRDPLYHRPNFLAILAELRLTPDDYLLEIGCGGGALLHDALEIVRSRGGN